MYNLQMMKCQTGGGGLSKVLRYLMLLELQSVTIYYR